jgi:hypothetical protein
LPRQTNFIRSTTERHSLSPADARQIAEEAYIYGYSLITTEVTRVQGSNVARPEGTKAPTGQFGNVERYLRVCREGAAIHFL